jgi:NADPH:quinone reductase-like Zn-dependent oxidoreductase
MAQDFLAVRFHEYGPSDRLLLEKVTRPALKPTEVLVEVHYAGVNPIDWKIRSGYLKEYMPVPLPFTPGIDFSGVVAELGSAVEHLRVGQEVFGIGRGSYAEFTVAEAGDVLAVPAALGLEKAAAVPVAALTAWKMVEDAGVKGGMSVVVQGAAGGVGLFALQFARPKGASVTGVASAGNADFVRGLGAERVVDYKKGPLEAEIRDADVVLDTVGGETLEKSYALLKKGGVVVSVAGQVSEAKATERGVRALGSGRGPTEHLKEIAALFEKKSLRLEIGKVFPLAEAKAAQDLSQTGHGRGRILLKVK